jgi:hypothetical protein
MSAPLKLWIPTRINMYEEFPALHTYLTTAKNDSYIGEDSEGDLSRCSSKSNLVGLVSKSDTPSTSNVIPIFNR